MGTKRVYPNSSVMESPISSTSSGDFGYDFDGKYAGEAAEVLTVWRKSLLFNCSGFTVFDSYGNLAFRVDSYSSSAGSGGEVVLMDAAGHPLFTSRRKGRVFGPDQWVVYDGEGFVDVKPRFSAVKKQQSSSSSKSLAHVRPCSGGAATAGGYEVEGSYSQRRCTVYDGQRRIAEIKQKEAAANGAGFGADVFRLVVQPGIDTTVAMAIVVLLDQMFGSSGR